MKVIMISKRTIVPAAVALLLGVVGCAEKQVGVARGRGESNAEFGVILSQEGGDHLRYDTAVSQERVSRDPAGILHVSVPLRSAVEHTQYLEYQYSFFDGSGRKSEGPMGWTPITLEAGSPGTIQFASSSQTATEFQLVIRYQR